MRLARRLTKAHNGPFGAEGLLWYVDRGLKSAILFSYLVISPSPPIDDFNAFVGGTTGWRSLSIATIPFFRFLTLWGFPASVFLSFSFWWPFLNVPFAPLYVLKHRGIPRSFSPMTGPSLRITPSVTRKRRCLTLAFPFFPPRSPE